MCAQTRLTKIPGTEEKGGKNQLRDEKQSGFLTRVPIPTGQGVVAAAAAAASSHTPGSPAINNRDEAFDNAARASSGNLNKLTQRTYDAAEGERRGQEHPRVALRARSSFGHFCRWLFLVSLVLLLASCCRLQRLSFARVAFFTRGNSVKLFIMDVCTVCSCKINVIKFIGNMVFYVRSLLYVIISLTLKSEEYFILDVSYL